MAPRMTKAERIARDKLMQFLFEETHQRDDISLSLRKKVPEAWHTLERDLDVIEDKEKITLRLDRSVARFYKAMGPGYQARISRILALWANMKIADALRVEEAVYAQIKMLNDADDKLIAEGETPIEVGRE